MKPSRQTPSPQAREREDDLVDPQPDPPEPTDDEDSDLEDIDMRCTDADDKRWDDLLDVFVPDDDEFDPLPNPGDYWHELPNEE